MYLLISLVGGAVGTLTGIINDCEWWQILIFLIVYTIVQVGGKVLINILEKKGLLSSEDADKLEDKLDDVLDDGKVNDSNKKEGE